MSTTSKLAPFVIPGATVMGWVTGLLIVLIRS